MAMESESLKLLLALEVQSIGQKVLGEIAGDLEHLAGSSKGLDGMSGTLHGVGAGMTTAGIGLMGVSAGIAAGIGGLVKEGADFQKLMTEIRNNTTMTEADVQQMHDAVLKIGEDTGSSFDALGKGFMHIVNLTSDAAHATDILSVANESAVSTGGDVEKTANILANLMHEYGADVAYGATETERHANMLEKASHFMGVMHLAAAEANMTLEQFNENGGTVFAWAANLGIPFEQASAAFATLTKHGFNAAEASTQVYNMMEHLIKVTPKSRDELEALSQKTGIDLVGDFTAAGVSTKGLTGIITDLHEAFAKLGMSEADQTAEVMKLIPNIRGGAAMFTLLGTGAKDYADILGDLTDKQKTDAITNESFQNTQKTLAFQTKQLGQELHVMAIELGESLMPVVMDLVREVKPIIKDFADWTKEHKDLIAQVLPLVAAIAAAVGIFLTIGGVVAMVVAVMNPVSLIVMGIIAAIAAGFYIWTHWDEIMTNAGETLQSVRDWLNNLHDRVGPLMDIILALLGPIGWAIEALMHWDDVTKGITQSVRTLGDVLGGIGGAIGDALGGAGQLLGGTGQPPNVPGMAEGGIAYHPTLALIGEGHEPEVVAPLSRLRGLVGAGDGGGRSQHIVVQFMAPVYGMSNFQDAVVAAIEEGKRRGRI